MSRGVRSKSSVFTTALLGVSLCLLLGGILGCPVTTTPPDPNNVDPNTVDPNNIDPNDVDPNDVDPNDVDPNDVDPNDVDPNDAEPNDIIPGDSGVTGKYFGSESCGLCHVNLHADWADTLHAGALETLAAIGQAENADCLPCHTVGFGEEGGYVDRETTNALKGVGCESCHGPARDHAQNLSDASLRPPVDIGSDVCGVCHTGAHHPTIDEWNESGHAGIDDHVAERIVEGSLSSCAECHSGDVFYLSVVQGETVEEDAFLGMDPADLNPITCAVCHDPHMRTGNATAPDEGRDYQLRYPEDANPEPTNTIAATTDADRFNLCGQCHRSRGREWTATSRGPHHSVQSNVYVGEMPTPEAETEPLVPSIASVHLRAAEQCSTCHLHREDFESETAPAIAGHTFMVNYDGCAAVGCHSSAEEAETRGMTYQGMVEFRLEDIKARLDALVDFDGNPATIDWEYSAEGGVAGSEDPNDPNAPWQGDLSDEILQVRFLLKYAEYDGSYGIHNPDYVESILDEAEWLLFLAETE